MQIDYASIKHDCPVTRHGIKAAAMQMVLATGVCFLSLVSLGMFGGFIDQPHPGYSSGQSWIIYRLIWSSTLAKRYTSAFLIAIVASAMIDWYIHRSIDTRFAPTFARLRLSLRFVRSRLIFAGGFLGVLGYLASTEIKFIAQNSFPHGGIWPPERVFLTVLWAWCALWLGETLAPPARIAWIAALIWLCLSLWLGWPMSNSWLRE